MIECFIFNCHDIIINRYMISNVLIFNLISFWSNWYIIMCSYIKRLCCSNLFLRIWKPRWKEPLFNIKKKIPFHLILITSFYMHGNLVCTGNNNTLIMCIVGLCKWKCYWVYVCARYNVPSSGHKYCKLKILIAAVFFIVFLASNISN